MTINPQLGFGCSRLFGDSETRQSRELIEAALRAGIRHFDTAPAYGYGTSESALGEILYGIRDVTIATKYGLEPENPTPAKKFLQRVYRQFARPVLSRFPELKRSARRANQHARPAVFDEDARAVARALSRSEIQLGLERSLNRLRRDRIGIFLLHEPDQFTLDSDVEEQLVGFQRLGKINEYGLGYDRLVMPPPSFGSVLQCDLRGIANLASQQNRTVITHGVVSLKDPSFAARAPSFGIAEFFRREPSSILLFSASTTRQINEVSAIFNDALAKFRNAPAAKT
jgi:hypothetical protein